MNQWRMKLIFIMTAVFAMIFVPGVMAYGEERNVQFSDNFDYQELSGWVKQAVHGTQFGQSGNTIRIIHSGVPNGFDNIHQTFTPMAEAVFEFDARLGSENNDGFSLLLESDGGYDAAGGLGFAFQSNRVMIYIDNQWQEIYTVPFHEWRHYRIVSTLSWLAVYINDDLKIKRSGNFSPRSLIKFSDFGMCSGPVTNYLANIRTRAATGADYFTIYDDFYTGSLEGWSVSAPEGTGFVPFNGVAAINHILGGWGIDFMQRSFEPRRDVILEFDAKIGTTDAIDSLLVESDDTYPDGFYLSFGGEYLWACNGNGIRDTVAMNGYDVWNHYRIVYSASRIEVYVNGEYKYGLSGNYGPRSYFRFSNSGLSTVTNFLDNVCIRDHVPETNSGNAPEWTSDWTVQNPDGAQFIQDTSNDLVAIHHVLGTESNDYLQREFRPLQNVSFEFDAKIGVANNTGRSLEIQSDGGYSDSGGLYLVFNQNTLEGLIGGSRQNIQTVNFDEWNHYRIVSTLTNVRIYINGILKYTYNGVFKPRSFLRFSNCGQSAPTNYIKNICIYPVVPDATITNSPDWGDDWVVHNPDGTRFIRENGAVTIRHAWVGWGNDYLQCNFVPSQNVILDFDAKIGSGIYYGLSLTLESNDDKTNGFFLGFYGNYFWVFDKGSILRSTMVGFDQWDHYRIVYTLSKIKVYINNELKYTVTGTYNPRSFFRFGSAGYILATSYIDNVVIQTGVDETTTPPVLQVLAPVEGQITKDSTIMVNGEVAGQLPVEVTVNGIPAQVSGVLFTLADFALAEGNNQLAVIATDGNGNTSQVTIGVIRDSAPPQFSDILPEDNTVLSTLNIPVSGQIVDASPVTLTVNGVQYQYPVDSGVFTALITGVEGWNDIVMEVWDTAGNITTVTRRVFIDTVPPAGFTPVADVTGWTQNNQPEITFSTWDPGSGIDHYEIAAADGNWITPVTSPYRFESPIPDGEQVITVKAVDRAGNFTAGMVTVAIDATPPGPPEGFEVIPGISRVIIGWIDPVGDISGYRLYRMPAFSGMPYREILRNPDGSLIPKIIDTEVEPGAEYSYSLAAIDRAGNFSPTTASSQAKVGIAVQSVDTEATTVKFENCRLDLAEEALTEAGTVIVEQFTQPLPASDFAAPVDVTFSITLQDEAGQEIKAPFAAPVTFQVSYDAIELPEGFTDEDLGIYWYNREGGYWERVDYCVNNTAQKTLTVTLNHFSEYKVMASKYTAPSLDSYYNMGISPYQSYFQNNIENVSTSGGSLLVMAADLVIPGPGGLNLEVKRIYDSGAAEQAAAMAINYQDVPNFNLSSSPPPRNTIKSFSGGWSLNLPWVEEPSDNGQYLRLPEGQTIKIEWKDNRFEYHQGAHFVLERQTHGYAVFLGWREVTDGYTLTLADGSKYQFDAKGRPIQRKDPSEKFQINYTYRADNEWELACISDNAGRIISFEYTTINSKKVIARIWTGGGEDLREFKYLYNQNGDLNEVSDPLDRKTAYQYSGFDYRYRAASGSVKTTTIQLLTEIDYPTGGKSVYTIATISQDFIPSGGNQTRYGQRYMVREHGLEGKITRYDYVMNTQSGTVAPNSYVLSAAITEGYYDGETFHGEKQVRETYRQIVEKGWKDPQGNPATAWYLVDSLSDLSSFKGSILTGGRVMMRPKDTPVENYQEIERVVYVYPAGYLKLRLAGSIEHFRGGRLTYIETLDYDDWGNMTRRYDGSRGLEETWTYEPDHPRIKQLLKEYRKTNYNPETETSTVVDTSYIYGDDHSSAFWVMGKPSMVKVSAPGQESRETEFTYDENGNLATQKSPNGLITEFRYDEHFFPVARKYKGVRDAVDQLVGPARTGDAAGEITLKYQFNSLTGLKAWEEDGLGRKTQYTYDKLNRVTRVTLPDDDTVDDNNPYREYVFTDTDNTCEFHNEKGQKTLFNFDNLGRLKSIVKFTDNNTREYSKVTYRYDVLGRIDQVSLPFDPATTERYYTRYEYDGLNRVTRVTFPAKAGETADFAGISYDDLTNTVTITDENGGVVTERSDWANRLVEAVQQCAYEGETLPYEWRFRYDAFGNRILQTDPAGNESAQTFDGYGQLSVITLPKTGVILPGTTTMTLSSPAVSYSYDKMGQKISETSPNGGTANYRYDQLGRLVKATATATDVFSGDAITSDTMYEYDAAGNRVKTTDGDGRDWTSTYSARGFLLTETDPLGNTTRYQYDALGNKTAVSDPRNTGPGDRRYTTWFIYDDQNRLVRTVLPDNTPPSNTELQSGSYDNPFIEVTYDRLGNKLTERDVNGLVAFYDYDLRGRVIRTGIMEGETRKVKSQFTYDGKGNRTRVESVSTVDDVLDNVVQFQYDSLDRLRQTIYPQDINEKYGYDALGNKLWAEDGRGNRANYTYSPLGWVTAVKDPLQQTTRFEYDPNGNRVRQISANGLVTQFKYDELNRLKEKIDSLGNSARFSYDRNGNRLKMVDPRGSVWDYRYDENNRLKRIDVNGADSSSYYVEYQYDKAGNRTVITDSGNTVKYNFQDGQYQPDPLNRITSVERSFDGAAYRTGYQYDKGLLTGIQYPEAAGWLNYTYNGLKQLAEVVGFTKPQGIRYDAGGALKSISYANGVTTNYSYDANRRLSSLTTGSGSSPNIQSLDFIYDKSNNITEISGKKYTYDANNQLIKAVTPGKFLESKETEGEIGFSVGDYLGTSGLSFNIYKQAVVSLDYDGSSIGLDFGTMASGIKKILLVPGAGQAGHRIKEGTFDIYSASDTSTYTLISRTDWEYHRDDNGVISITLKQAKSMRYLKLHVWFDNRDTYFDKLNRGTFINEIAQMLRVYREADARTEEYGYDEAGNRTLTRITLIQAEQRQSLYYANSDRLKTDGKNAYAYDAAGNLVKKGNMFSVDGDNVTFTESGEGVEYWTYKYDLLNRLTEVRKNGTIVGEYGYDPEGLRVVKKVYTNGVNTDKVHYVFSGIEQIFEKRISDGRIRSYVYAGLIPIARVDGVIGDTAEKKYWYHTDHVGSVKVVTNQTGAVVWNADYLPFGQQYMKNKLDPDFEEDDLGFTGKGYHADVGLYYFNARWYDADTGRFISEDPVGDPSNPNLYSYCANNPINRIDPTGLQATLGDIGIANPGGVNYNPSIPVGGPVLGSGNPGTGGGGPTPVPAPPPTSPTPMPDKGPSTKEGPNLNSEKNEESDDDSKSKLDKAKEEYKKAAQEYEKARGTKNESEAKEKFNKALDALIDAAGFDTNVYNHKTIIWEGNKYIHVNKNPDVVIAVVKVAKELGASKIVISEGDRTRWEHDNIVYKGKTPLCSYDGTQHGDTQGNIAADVTFYKADGTAFSKEEAAKAAKNVSEIGAILTYKSMGIVHLDLRSKTNGQPIIKYYDNF